MVERLNGLVGVKNVMYFIISTQIVLVKELLKN